MGNRSDFFLGGWNLRSDFDHLIHYLKLKTTSRPVFPKSMKSKIVQELLLQIEMKLFYGYDMKTKNCYLVGR